MSNRDGYLYELPLLVIATLFLAAVLYPIIPEPWNLAAFAPVAYIALKFIVYNSFFGGK
ncbi:MAG: hypothetical protein HQK87_09020 [Nitrospinae bacterium]|nr:hypothetical protein [Nitrospinota bacterium]